MEQKRKVSFNYKWINIALCFLMVMVCLGFCSSSRGLYLSPMTEALGIKRSLFSVGDSIRYVSTAVINIFFGIMIAKYGTKKLICAGIFFLIASSLIYSVATSIIWFYIAGMFLGIGFSWTTTTMVGAVVNRWCSEKKGTIMGAVLASNGIGAAIAAQILTPVIYDESTAFGYRRAYLITVLILIVVLVMMLVFYKEKRGTITHEVKHSKKESSSEWEGLDISKIKRNTYFYITAACIFVTGMVLQGITGVANAHMKDVGIDAAFIGLIASIHSLTLALSKFFAGYLYDKNGLKSTALICNFAAVLATGFLAFLSESATGKILAIMYSVVASMALPLETIMLPIFASDLFGHKSYEKILGIFVSVNTAGYAVGVPLMNGVYDIFGTYKYALLICSGIMVLVMVVVQFVVTASEKWKTN